MLEHRSWAQLGGGDYGWLKAKHHFAIGGHGNPIHKPLGSLIVWNDDEIAPGTGFPLHGHANVEIITYVRQGAVTHRDSLGNSGRIQAGDIQVMSAGTGIRHSEENLGTVPLKVYQIWIRSRETGGEPRWANKTFPNAERTGRLVPLASGIAGEDEALPIRADARVFGSSLLAGEVVEHALDAGRYAYVVLTRGAATVNGEWIGAGDGVAITEEPAIRIAALEDTELILVDTI
jgi:redox-sensitive bicupin YhaK (pirin superfamily)